MHFPPLPELPPQVAGKSFVMVNGCFLGGRVQADLLLAPFHSLHPVVDTFGTVPLPRIGDIAAEPVDPMPGPEWARLLSDLGPETIDAIVSATRPGTQHRPRRGPATTMAGPLARPAARRRCV